MKCNSYYYVCYSSDKHDNMLEMKHANSAERIIIGGENDSHPMPTNNRISNELLQKFEGKSREVHNLNLLLKVFPQLIKLNCHYFRTSFSFYVIYKVTLISTRKD